MVPYKCPHAEKIPLQCDVMYSLDEFYRQLSEKLKRGGPPVYFHIGGKGSRFVCKNDPEMCPRYIEHLVTNIIKYKQR